MGKKIEKVAGQYRQGDVLIQKAKGPPAAAEERKWWIGELILAQGEATGHHHKLELPRGVLAFAESGSEGLETMPDPADWWKSGDDQFVSVPNPAQVTHQEHATIALDPGMYRVRIQREYSPQEIRRVAD